MKKVILATITTFGISVLGAGAYACDGMKGHAKGDKSDESDSQAAKQPVNKDGKSATKPDQKS